MGHINRGEKSINARGLAGAGQSLLTAPLFERRETFLLIIRPKKMHGRVHPNYPLLDFSAIDMLALQEDVLLRQTLEKIRRWLSETRGIFFLCPSADNLHRMQYMLLSYDLPLRLLSPAGSILEIAGLAGGIMPNLVNPEVLSARQPFQ